MAPKRLTIKSIRYVRDNHVIQAPKGLGIIKSTRRRHHGKWVTTITAVREDGSRSEPKHYLRLSGGVWNSVTSHDAPIESTTESETGLEAAVAGMDVDEEETEETKQEKEDEVMADEKTGEEADSRAEVRT